MDSKIRQLILDEKQKISDVLKMKETQIFNMQTKISELKSDVDTCNQENQKLRSDVDTCNQENQKLRSDINTCNQENQKLRSDINNYEISKQKIKRYIYLQS